MQRSPTGILKLIGIAIAATGFLLAQEASLDISVDQVGYRPDAEKLGMVRTASAQPVAFSVKRSKDKSTAFSGKLSSATTDTDSGDQVAVADFSPLKQAGSYYLDVAGVGHSWDFQIASDIYRNTYYLAARSFYGQRCGTAVDLGPQSPQFRHAICHTIGNYDSSSGTTGNHISAKGWHDAGDYGRYVVNSGISTGTLLWAWEIYHDRIVSSSLDIPESGGATPDLLSEVRWNLDWMLSMQDTDGGVFHKQTSTHFCGFIMPEADSLPSSVIGSGQTPFKTSCATADLAAVAAIAARLFKPYDAAYADTCLRAARSAWKWLGQHPAVVFRNPANVTTGEYGDNDCSDELLWAASELWRTTGERPYHDYYLAHYQAFLDKLTATDPQSWAQVSPLALWGYALDSRADPEASSAIRRRAIAAADSIVARLKQNSYRTSLTSGDYKWGSNGVVANYNVQLLVAHQLEPHPAYVAAALDNMHYLLGRNTFSVSWVTQVGQHAFRNPHHRLSSADKVDLPWPGLLSGGPNSGRQDDLMKRLIPADAKPARCYIDMTGAYACNEVAINWNAPLVFTLAAFQEPKR